MSEETKKKQKPGKFDALKGFLLIVAIVTIVIKCTSDPESETIKVPTSEVKQSISEIDKKIATLFSNSEQQDYFILSSTDISHGARSRYKTFIYSPTAKTNDQILATAAGAAGQIQREKRVQYSYVVIFDAKNNGSPYLSVDFAPDKKGNEGEEDLGTRFEVKWINKLTE